MLPKIAMATFPTTNAIETTFQLEITNVLDRSSVKSFTAILPGPTIISDMRPISASKPRGVASGIMLQWPTLDDSQLKASKMLHTYLP